MLLSCDVWWSDDARLNFNHTGCLRQAKSGECIVEEPVIELMAPRIDCACLDCRADRASGLIPVQTVGKSASTEERAKVWQSMHQLRAGHVRDTKELKAR